MAKLSLEHLHIYHFGVGDFQKVISFFIHYRFLYCVKKILFSLDNLEMIDLQIKDEPQFISLAAAKETFFPLISSLIQINYFI